MLYVKIAAVPTSSLLSPPESTQAKKESQCTKQTGVYDPPYLATCLVTHPFVSGTFEQVWSLKSAGGTVSIPADPHFYFLRYFKYLLSFLLHFAIFRFYLLIYSYW